MVAEYARLNIDGTIQIKTTHSKISKIANPRSEFLQIEGFPFNALAHPNFKNFRNVSIDDLDGNGTKEILVCLNETLFALNADGSILWSSNLDGTSNFPPAIADINNDGLKEVAVQTYGIPQTGNVYLFDHEGNLQNGWPLNFDNHFFLNGVTIVDLNQDGNKEILASERINSTNGRIHALDISGNSFDPNWPVEINGTPAFTPSAGDIDNDGEIEIITASTTAIYVFNNDGSIAFGFPFKEEGTKFSYQSPLLADLDDNNLLEIIGSRHGDLPGTYVLQTNGQYFANWPDYDNIWTYAPPSIADINNDAKPEIFFGRPYFSETSEDGILLGYDNTGIQLENYPIKGLIGTEGLISIADIDNDGDFELITASNTTVDGMGFINAYHIENQEIVENFPIRVQGFSFLNGANLSDINNDGLLDLTALSYQSKFDATSPDSAFINVFNLETPFDPDKILFNGYKGSNDHTGLISHEPSSVVGNNDLSTRISIIQNPVSDVLMLSPNNLENSYFTIFDVKGDKIRSSKIISHKIEVSDLAPGSYFFSILYKNAVLTIPFIKI
jgi:hypothetical protein